MDKFWIIPKHWHEGAAPVPAPELAGGGKEPCRDSWGMKWPALEWFWEQEFISDLHEQQN